MSDNKQLTPTHENETKSEQLAASERFTNQVYKEFGTNVSGMMSVTDYQRTLIQGYFIVIDRALKNAEEERLRKNAANTDHKYDNDLAVNWNTVNLTDLALDLVRYARIGLDMTQENMLYPVPYKNKKKNIYDITLMEGYNGKRYIAEKYGLDVPINVTVEVVYSSDIFKPIKKSRLSPIDSYEFEIVNPFNRGNIVGGFAYHEFEDPTKNKLIIMTMADIEKRKPRYASANFWGGTKIEKVNGKNEEVECEGWLHEMVYKTIVREAYGARQIPRDPKKIDDNYQYIKMREAHYAEIEAMAEIEANANQKLIDTTPVNNEITIDSSSNANMSAGINPGTSSTASDGPDF